LPDRLRARSAPQVYLLTRSAIELTPFIAILEGRLAIIDAAGTSLSGTGRPASSASLKPPVGADGLSQRARTKPLRYIAVDRIALRSPPKEDGPPQRPPSRRSSPVAKAFRPAGIGIEIVGPQPAPPLHSLSRLWSDGSSRTREPAPVHSGRRRAPGGPRRLAAPRRHRAATARTPGMFSARSGRARARPTRRSTC